MQYRNKPEQAISCAARESRGKCGASNALDCGEGGRWSHPPPFAALLVRQPRHSSRHRVIRLPRRQHPQPRNRPRSRRCIGQSIDRITGELCLCRGDVQCAAGDVLACFGGGEVIDGRRCPECGWVGNARDLLRAASPFNDEDQIEGCPMCTAVTQFEILCQVENCLKEATCGTPLPDGSYVRCCGDHYRVFEQREAAA
jgi:hypothetical protein